jgi:uncharacterized ion transporter superfamily protein YfcC
MFLLTSIIAGILIFVIGGLLSGGFLTSEVFGAWLLVSIIGGIVSGLSGREQYNNAKAEREHR